jgi:phospholipid transport system substrate-binding protein
MKKLLSFIITLLLFSSIVLASQKDDVKAYFGKKLTIILDIVQNNSNNKSLRDELIIQNLDDIFDFELMGKLSLRKKWKQISKEQQKQFVKLYIKRMQKSYSSKLDNYKDQKVKIVSVSQPKKSRIIIATQIISSSDSYSVKYKFYKPKYPKAGKYSWLIYDVDIMGVSILKTDIAQFKEYLKLHSFNELLDKMAK